ncbi:rna-directed dna polymerase from mobile element jockey- hypothetical protein [Limosa lapponica baueri]|uniref:Rna-directed dna polymerase from mobile element jockey-like n=1 Tax=Limosa lapponica baueri TaxID=1758121 RepID=A0A2I0UH56_LIMLA|nr:rna-directed dna polymerase from mobile element jockey- hypothetical protein [Limosa lapponica baueri]
MFRGSEESKCQRYLQERQEERTREAQAGPALLSLQKMMEQLVLETISRNMMDKKVIKSSQHGFMKGKSCLTNLIAFSNKVTSLVDEGRTMNIVYLDSVNYVECSCSKFVDDTKVGEAANTPDGYAAIKKDINRLEKWDNKNLMKFNRGKYEVLHLRKSNPRHLSRPREMILPFCSALVRPYLDYCVLFSSPQYKRDMDILESPIMGH